jgi:hypothetical protein
MAELLLYFAEWNVLLDLVECRAVAESTCGAQPQPTASAVHVHGSAA